MSTMNLVSVIIPTYKTSGALKIAIDSVLEQDYKNVEILVIDDNDPNDAFRSKTEKIMEEYANEKKVIYIKHEHNKNGSAARNTGIRASKGEYIAFLDDDDYMIGKRLTKSVDCLMKSDNNVGGCCVNYLKCYKKMVYKKSSYDGISDSFVPLLSGERDYGAGSTLMIKRSVIDKIGLFDETYKRHQDWEYLIRLFRYYKIVNIPEIGTVICSKTIAEKPNTKVRYEAKKKLLSDFEDDLKKINDDDLRKIKISQDIEMISWFLAENKYKDAFLYFKKSKNGIKILFHKLSYIIYSIIIGIFPYSKLIVFYINSRSYSKYKNYLTYQ